MNTYEVFVGNRQIYQGVSYQRVMQIFADVTKDYTRKCNYCQIKEIYVSKDALFNPNDNCPDADYSVINQNCIVDCDSSCMYCVCKGTPNTIEQVLVRCMDTDTGKITEIGG